MSSARPLPASRVMSSDRCLTINGFCDEPEPLADALPHQGIEQLVLAGEAGVDGALGQAGGSGNVIERGAVIPTFGEHLAGGLQQTRARLGARRARALLRLPVCDDMER